MYEMISDLEFFLLSLSRTQKVKKKEEKKLKAVVERKFCFGGLESKKINCFLDGLRLKK